MQPAREHLGDAAKFAEADDLAIGDVANVHLAKKWDHVVFAEGEYLYVLDDHEAVVVLVEDGLVELGCVDARCTCTRVSVGI